MRTRIKICGLTREADVAAAVAGGADAVGFVCYAKSPRYVTPLRLRALARHLPPFATPVLLFVNASADLIEDALAAVPDGVNIDGTLLEDASRGGGCCVLQSAGTSYSWEALPGLFVSAELLHRTGSYDP